MFRKSKPVFKIKSVPSDDTKSLEALLNEMSQDGWDLYSLQEYLNNLFLFHNIEFFE